MTTRLAVRGGASPAELAALAAAVETLLADEAPAAPVDARPAGWRAATLREAVGDGAPWHASGTWNERDR